MSSEEPGAVVIKLKRGRHFFIGEDVMVKFLERGKGTKNQVSLVIVAPKNVRIRRGDLDG